MIQMNLRMEEMDRTSYVGLGGMELPYPLGCASPADTSTYSPAWKVFQIIAIGILWRLPHRHNQPFLTPLASLEKGGAAETPSLGLSGD